MEFSLLPPFRRYVWKKIQEGLIKGVFPYSDQIKYMGNQTTKTITTVSWEIIRNALTSDLDISIFIEELPEDETMKKIDVQISIPTKDSCIIESLNVDVVNWDESFDKEYSLLSDKIRDNWNQT